MTDKLTQEKHTLVLKRIPKSDRWKYVDPQSGLLSTELNSLTEALEFVFGKTNQVRYLFDAREDGGTVYMVETEEYEKPPEPTYSIYGEY